MQAAFDKVFVGFGVVQMRGVYSKEGLTATACRSVQPSTVSHVLKYPHGG